MRVEVVWVGEGGAVVRHAVELPEGATVDDALGALREPLAGALRRRIDDESLSIAVYGKPRTRATGLHDGDRIELVGELVADPKAARRLRVRQRREEGADPRWKRR